MDTKRKAQNLRSRWGGRIPEEAIRVKSKGAFQQPFFSVSLTAYKELPELTGIYHGNNPLRFPQPTDAQTSARRLCIPEQG